MTSPQDSIGLFDSGVGGFSVVKAIQNLLPHENLVYFGDTARMPYGNKSKEAIIRYSLENAYFLQQHKIKLLIIACNTASVHALETLKSTINIPVISITDDVFSEVAKTTESREIAVLGTKSTIKSGHFEKGFIDFFPDIKVTSISCPLFATLVEEGLENHAATMLLAKEYLQPILNSNIDTILLACTHYPFLIDILKQICSSNMRFIDPAFACAQKTKQLLNELNLINSQPSHGVLSIFASNDEHTLKMQAEHFLKNYQLSSANL
jgi:glutamate racemase